jgi:hypothetical protein
MRKASIAALLILVLASVVPLSAQEKKPPTVAQPSPDPLQKALDELDGLVRAQQWAPVVEKAAGLVQKLRGSASSEADKPPRRISGADPVHSGPLAQLALPKWVWLQVVVDPEGRVVEPVVLSGDFAEVRMAALENMPLGLSLAAMETVCDWRFEPARYQGVPVKVHYRVTVNFQGREFGGP